MKKYTILLLLFISFTIFSNIKTFGKGPLFSKNVFSPYLIFMNLPGQKALIDSPHNLKINTSIYYSQDFNIYAIYNYPNEDWDIFRVADFESFILESSSFYSINKYFEIGMSIRLISYYGGVLDSFTQYWHDLFSLPNGGREYCPINEVFVDFKTQNGFDIFLDKPAVGFGDIDTWFKFNFYTNKYSAFSLTQGFKIPTGQLSNITGSGYPDYLMGILIDIYPIQYFSMYLQGAAVFPLQFMFPDAPAPYPSFNAIISLEFSPVKFFSIITQMNIKTSHIKGYVPIYNNLGMQTELAGSPQTNLLVGVVFTIERYCLQIYFEEDTFTNAGTDYTISVALSYDLRLK